MKQPFFLNRFDKLRHLSLASSQISDGDLNHLVALSSVESLDLSGTRIGNASVGNICKLPRLTELYVVDTNVTDEGISDLQEALPNCEIRH